MVKTHHHQYAFNFALTAVTAPDKDEHVVLRVDRWTGPPAEPLQGPRTIDENALSLAELDTKLNHSDTDLALWVGMRPAMAPFLRAQRPDKVPADDQALSKDVADARPARGKSVNTLPSVPVWPRQSDCARVVVRFGLKETLQFYELRDRNPVTGLCVADQINSQECFFFEAYRDDALTGVDKRMSQWPKIIKQYIASEINKDLAKGGFRAAKDTCRVEFAPNTSSLLSLEGLASELVVSGSAWILDEMEAAVLRMDGEIRKEEISDLVVLHKLLDIRDVLPDDIEGPCVEALKRLFPALMRSGNLTNSKVLAFSFYLRETETRVTYGRLRQEYGMFCMYADIEEVVEWDKITADAAARWIAQHRNTVYEPDRVCPPKFSDVSTDLKCWLRHHVDIMKDLLSRHEENMEAMVEYHGSATCADNLWQMWDNLAESPDTDAARHFALQSARWMGKEMVARCDITKQNLVAYLKLLERSLGDIDAEEVGESMEGVEETEDEV